MTDLQAPVQSETPTPPVPPPSRPQMPSDNARPFSALAITTFTFAVLALLLSWVPVADLFLALPFAAVSLAFLGFALHATRRNGPRRGRRLAVAAPIVAVVAAIVFAVTWTAYGEAFMDDLGESAANETAVSAEADKKPKTKEKPAGDIWNDQIHIRVNSVTRNTVLDDGAPGIVVAYGVGNESPTSISPIWAVDVEAYQNGRKLESANFFKQPVTGCRSAENVPCYIELADANQEVQPGSSIGILEGFQLVDEESPVTLEFTGGFDKSGQKFTHTFALQ